MVFTQLRVYNENGFVLLCYFKNTLPETTRYNLKFL